MVEAISSIREAIRNLAAFFVLSTVLLRLLPGESYARYLRFFLGLLLVVSLLKPLISALSAEDLLAEAFSLSGEVIGSAPESSGAALTIEADGAFTSSRSILSSSGLEESIAAAAAGEWTEIFSMYQGEIQALFSEQIADLGVAVTDLSVGGQNEKITVVIARVNDDQSDVAQEDEKQGGAKQDGATQDDAKPDDTMQDDGKQGDVKQDGATQDDAKPDDTMQDDGKQGDAKQNGTMQDDAKQGDAVQSSERQSDSDQAGVDQDEKVQDEAAEISVGAIRIQIPVISVFADAGKAADKEDPESDGLGSEDESDAGESAGENSIREKEEGNSAGETALSDAEMIAAVRSRIAEYCGISEESVEAVMANE